MNTIVRPPAPPEVRQEGGAWAVWRGVRGSWNQFWHDAKALPRAVWIFWGVGLAITLAVTLGVTALVIQLGKYGVANGLQPWDEYWLRRSLEIDFLSFQRAIWIETWGSSAFLLPIVAVATTIAIWRRRPLIAASIVAVYVLHDAAVMFGWSLWDRARPEIVAGGIAAPGLHSYPSGHAANVVATFGFFAYLWARRSGSWIERGIVIVLFLVLLTAVSVSRVRMGTHWPSDMIAGSVIGLVWLVGVILTVRGAERRAER